MNWAQVVDVEAVWAGFPLPGAPVPEPGAPRPRSYTRDAILAALRKGRKSRAELLALVQCKDGALDVMLGTLVRARIVRRVGTMRHQVYTLV